MKYTYYPYYIMYYDRKTKELGSTCGHMKAKSYGKVVDKILDTLSPNKVAVHIVIDGVKIQFKEG